MILSEKTHKTNVLKKGNLSRIIQGEQKSNMQPQTAEN